VGALLVTTVATLAVAAVALLGRLEQGLRSAALTSLVRDAHVAAADFERLHLTYVHDVASRDPKAADGHAERIALASQENSILSQFGASVVLFGSPDLTGESHPVLPTSPQNSTTLHDSFDDVPRAFRTRLRPPYIPTFGSINGKEYARVALRLRIGARPYVLAVRRPLDEVADAVAVVRNAFLTAALAGVGLTLLLGIPLSATLVRRLRRLRQAALRLSLEGPSVHVPEDRARDEVGDLARAFATMARQLKQQEDARRAFVATASHELRTPLTSLEGMLELLEEDLSSGDGDLEEARDLLERARAQSRRLGRLAADLLDLSRIDAEVQLRSEPVELGELSRAVLAEFELGGAERAISFELDDSLGKVWALGDPGSVARIVRILVDNAVRVSPRGAEVKVELQNGQGASLSVCDEGPGVPEHEREMIFQRFKRGSQTGGAAGFGLGLAIGRELAQRMGGELVLDDTDGRGARFTLRLPMAAAPEQDRLAVR
jgi:signal transduction histidine kinase